MKIVQLLPELNEGGVERGTVELSRELVKLGFESIVISNGGKLVNQLEREGGTHIKYDVCSKNPFSAVFRVFGLRKILKELKPDILHVRSRVPAWLVYFANKSLKIPLVSTVHGLNSVNRYSEIMTKGDRVICISEVVRNYIMKNYNTSPHKITIIQRGVDLNIFNPLQIDENFITDFKNQFNLNGKFIVTSVGRITWLKDYETFIKAISVAKKSIPNIVGVIVGGVREDKNSYFESLKNLAAELDISENIVFTGSQNKMPEIYFLSDVMVNASLKMGNVARTITEALAMDTPVIATTYEGLNNVIIDNKNGYVIKTKDTKDLCDKILKSKNNTFGNIRADMNAEFTLEALVSSTINVYKSFKGLKI